MKKLLAILCAVASIAGALFFGVRLLNRFAKTANENRRERKARRVYTWEQDAEEPGEVSEPAAPSEEAEKERQQKG